MALAVLVVALPALAQTGPFGVGPKAPPPPADGFAGWILSVQAGFYRSLTQALRAARADSGAAYGVILLSLAYGVFHAAGPGHGKAVISAYLLANEASWRRGTLLALVSALLQGIVAVTLVVIAATLVRMTATQMGDAVHAIELAAYAGVVALGAWLIWTKGRALAAAVRGADPACVSGCDHLPQVDPRDLAAPGGLGRAAMAVVSVGLRPCSGALIVLVFALANGIFWLGVAATFAMALGTAVTVAAIAALAVFAKRAAVRLAAASSGRGALVLRGVEFAAALTVTAFGAALLTGYIVAERVLPF